MNKLAGRGEDFPYIRIFIETTGNLDLANVGRFLQRLDTGARKIAQEQGWRLPAIEIESLATGSLDLKIKIAGLRVAQASLAVSVAALALGVAQYLKQEPAAVKSVHALLNVDRATTITVEGGGSATIINASNLPPQTVQKAAKIYPQAIEMVQERVERLTGPQGGIIHRYGGESFIELDTRPGLFIRIRDERADASEILEDNLRYTFDGVAHIPAAGPSFFVLHKAMRLG